MAGPRDVFSLLLLLEEILTRSAPSLVHEARLRSPASPEARQRLAAAVGLARLPPDLDDILRWHDGQDSGLPWASGVLHETGNLGSGRFVGVEEVLRVFEYRARLDSWKDAYVPILDDGGGNYIVFDTHTGAIETWDHEGEPTRLVGPSLRELLEEELIVWEEWFARRM
jgi:cell wall assembly regulator SMI1